MYNKLIGLCFIGILFAGCAKHEPLSMENANKIESSYIVIVVQQEELEAEVKQSNSGAVAGGGIIFALVDAAIESSRSTTAEEFVAPLRNNLLDINVREMLVNNLKASLGKSSWLKVSDIQVVPALSASEKKALLKNSSHNAVLVIDAAYKLEPGFKFLKTSATSELFLENGINSPKRIYNNTFLEKSEIVVGESEDDIALAWSNNSGELLKKYLVDGVNQVSQTIANDLVPASTNK